MVVYITCIVRIPAFYQVMAGRVSGQGGKFRCQGSVVFNNIFVTFPQISPLVPTLIHITILIFSIYWRLWLT